MPQDILEPGTVKKLQQVFNKIDIDRSGTISLDEFREACRKLSIKVGEDELRDFQMSDSSKDSELSFDEFCEFYVSRLKKTFDKIDLDKSGEIQLSELKHALEMLGFKSSLDEVKELLHQVDKDKSGSVNFEEFCNCFCYLPSPDFRIIVQQWATGLTLDTGNYYSVAGYASLGLSCKKIWSRAKSSLSGPFVGIIYCLP